MKYTFISDNSGKKFTVEYEIRNGRPYSIIEYEAPSVSAGQILRRAYKPTYEAKKGNIACYKASGRLKKFK
jgi:hypothetical protein